MNFFNFTKLRQAVVLSAVLLLAAVGASAEDAFSHRLGGGGSDQAWLKVNKLALGGVEDDGTLNEGYLSLKYNLIQSGVTFEWGWFLSNSMFLGFDVTGGWDILTIGLGLNCGYTLNLPYGLRVIPGVSGGFWFNLRDAGNDETDGSWDFVGPFLKIQWHSIELMYRGLLGYYDAEVDGFGWNQNQLMIGVYLNNSWLEYGGYTLNRRLATWGVNMVLPGVGSMLLMNDYIGGGTSFCLMACGTALLINASNESSIWIGAIALTAGGLHNIIIPWVRSNPNRTASRKADGFNFAVLPKDGGLGYAGAYTKSF